jgi:hypothetical protein
MILEIIMAGQNLLFLSLFDQGGDGFQGTSFETVIDVNESFAGGSDCRFDQSCAGGAAFGAGVLDGLVGTE